MVYLQHDRARRPSVRTSLSACGADAQDDFPAGSLSAVLRAHLPTARLMLRPFRFSDVPAVHAYLQDPEMGRYLEGAQTPPTEPEIAEIGYSIGRADWGRGLATEAAGAVITEAFASCGDLQRIQAGIHPENAASIRVAQRLGMTREGTLRAYAYVNGAVADEAVFAVVRDARPERGSA
jgi:RimJ/RimL family protein N-acetyltransferase